MKLVALDVDGTLTGPDGLVPAATSAALQALSVPYVLVSGRPRRWLDRFAAEVGASGVAVAANGAVTYDLATGRTIRAQTIAPADARACAVAIRGRLADALFAVERDDDPPFVCEPDYPARWTGEDPPAAELPQLLAAPVLKLLCRSASHSSSDDLYAAVADVVADLPVEVTHSSGTLTLLEIAAAGVDKATALAAYTASVGVDRGEVLAVGDGFNDIPMITWAGRGVAVAHAHPALLAVADEVCGTNDDDGVAAVLAGL